MTPNRQGDQFCVTREFMDRLLSCVDGCFHVKLSGEIGKFTNLQRLNLSNNELQELPSQIGDLTNLKHLDFSNARLKGLPIEITRLNLEFGLNIMQNDFGKDKTGKAYYSVSDMINNLVANSNLANPDQERQLRDWLNKLHKDRKLKW